MIPAGGMPWSWGWRWALMQVPSYDGDATAAVRIISVVACCLALHASYWSGAWPGTFTHDCRVTSATCMDL